MRIEELLLYDGMTLAALYGLIKTRSLTQAVILMAMLVLLLFSTGSPLMAALDNSQNITMIREVANWTEIVNGSNTTRVISYTAIPVQSYFVGWFHLLLIPIVIWEFSKKALPWFTAARRRMEL